jgi:hypothetical protein
VKKLFILPLLLLNLSSISQIPDYFGNNPSWRAYSYEVNNPFSHRYQVIENLQDSTFNGITYKWVPMHEGRLLRQVGRTLREGNSWPNGSDTLYVSYELNPGDTINGSINYNNDIILVDSLDSLLIGSEYRRILYYHVDNLGSWGHSHILIEGIGHFSDWGSSNGSLCTDVTYGYPGHYYAVFCYSQNDTIRYVPDTSVGCYYNNIQEQGVLYLNIFPNPSNGLIKIEGANLFNSKFQILDLQGRIIPFNLSIMNNELAEIEILSKGLFLLQLNNKSGSMSQLIKIE